MKCKKCGNELKESAKFCNMCGTAVSDENKTLLAKETSDASVTKRTSKKPLVIIIVLVIAASITASILIPTKLRKDKASQEVVTFEFEDFTIDLPSDMIESQNGQSKADYQMYYNDLMFNAMVWDNANDTDPSHYIDYYINTFASRNNSKIFSMEKDSVKCNSYGTSNKVLCYNEVKCFVNGNKCVLIEIQCMSNECRDRYKEHITEWFDTFEMK